MFNLCTCRGETKIQQGRNWLFKLFQTYDTSGLSGLPFKIALSYERDYLNHLFKFFIQCINNNHTVYSPGNLNNSIIPFDAKGD